MMRVSNSLLGGKTIGDQGYVKDLQAMLTGLLMIPPKLGNINFCGTNSNNCVLFSGSAQQPSFKSLIILTRHSVIKS